MKLTPWYPCNVKPVREGVYQVRMQVMEDRCGGIAIEEGFCYFGDLGWGWTCSTKREAKRMGHILGSQRKAWRGIAKGASK